MVGAGLGRRGRARIQWIGPTCRALRAPLLGALLLAAFAAVASVVLTLASARVPASLAGLLIAGFATTAAMALTTDPAADLLAAVPTGAGRRAAHRLVVGVPAAVAALGSIVWLSAVLAGRGGEAFPGLSIGPLMALVAIALAVDEWTGRTPQLATAVPVAVVSVAAIVPAHTWPGEMLGWWSTRAWPVVLVAVVATLAHRRYIAPR